MPRRFVFAPLFALVALAPALSFAASEDCPDGWFCEPNPAPPSPAPGAAPPPSGPGGPTAPARPGAPPAYDLGNYPQAPDAEPPPADEAELSLEVPPDNPPPKRRHRHRFREWGLNVHLTAARLNSAPQLAPDAWLGGLGFAFRYRPVPALAFEAGVDLLKRSDYPYYSRTEAALLLNTLLFFNPHDAAQIYALGGLGFSGAEVTVGPRADEAYFRRYEDHYSYFGAQLGLGLEVRITRRVAIAGDLIGFVRGRTDYRWHDDAEYVDPNTGRERDTTGGGLLRAGMTFYW